MEYDFERPEDGSERKEDGLRDQKMVMREWNMVLRDQRMVMRRTEDGLSDKRIVMRGMEDGCERPEGSCERNGRWLS